MPHHQEYSYRLHETKRFSPDPLTNVLRAGALELLSTTVRGEVSEFLAGARPLFGQQGLTAAGTARVSAGTQSFHWDRQGASPGSSGARSWGKR